MFRPRERAGGTLILLALLASAGCSERRRTVVIPGGATASDFQTLERYLSDPTVRAILARMPRYSGDFPPDPSGSYAFDGTVRASTFSALGSPVSADFCFGPPVGGRLLIVIHDPTLRDAGAASFIEGSGDRFTAYTAFKSVQSGCSGGTCELHQVNVFSGRRLANGDIDDLWIGVGVVGAIGDCCGSLLPGDFQVSLGYGTRVGSNCFPGTGAGPSDPSKVLAVVENDLVVELLVFVDDETLPRLYLPALSAGSFETEPGFSLYFETLQPYAGLDEFGNDILLGEIVNGLFPPDLTPAGGTSAYRVENQVGVDLYFAPLPVNQTRADIYSVVNVGIDIPWYPGLPGTGLDCRCSMAPDANPYVIGYYSYLVAPYIRPEQANAYFRYTSDDRLAAAFFGPFDLESPSGTVTFLVTY